MKIPGPLGMFPYGRHRVGDRGALAAAFTVSKQLRVVRMEFGTLLLWVSSTPQAALAQAEAMRKIVRDAFGDLKYSFDRFPLRVVANNGMIETHLPQAASKLIANPEVILAWADKLEEAAGSVKKQ